MQNNCCSAPGSPVDPALRPAPQKIVKEGDWLKSLDAQDGVAKFWTSASSRDVRPLLGQDHSESFYLKKSLNASDFRSASATGTASSGRTDGRWADGSHVHVIQGKRIYWADGTTTEVEDTSMGFSTTLWGTAYHGCMDRQNKVIIWNDNSNWVRLDEAESTLDGNWRTEGKSPQRHIVRGSTLYWADGTSSEINETVPGVFSLRHRSQSLFCRLEMCGQRLRWNDGDTWLRLASKGPGMSPRRVRLTLLCALLGVVLNCLFVLGASYPLRRDWAKYPAEIKHKSWSWPEWQVWQFALAWAAMPLLLVHGVWAVFLAATVDTDKPTSVEMETLKGRPNMLWLLEPMRLVALLHIIYYHEAPTTPMGRWGFAWISFFMVLAGFVGGYQLLGSDPEVARTTVLAHVLKRIKRLWPQYLLYVFVVSVPHYFTESLANGTVLPSWSGTGAACKKLFSWMGLLYVLGLQTLVPLDPHFDFVTKTCWFVPTLLLCEAFLPVWLRGIQGLLESVAQSITQKERLSGKVETARLLTAALALTLLAASFTAANALCVAFGKVFLRTRAYPENDLSEAVFWFMRFSPLGHWPQVLLGAVLAKTFLMMQSAEPESSEDDGEACCPEEVMPLSPPGRSVVLMAQDGNSEEVTPTWRLLHQLLYFGPWFLGAALGAALACLAVHLSTDELTNSKVIFLNCGAPAASFAAVILCLSQASLLLEPYQWLLRLVQIMGAVCFPAYLFVSMSEQLLWHFCTLLFDESWSLAVAHWFRIPFLALVQQLYGCLHSAVFPASK